MEINWKIIIEKKEIFTTKDFSIVRSLYQPLLGMESLSLYQTLYEFCVVNNFKTQIKWSFEELQKILAIDLFVLLQAKKKLEACGLLRSFEEEKSQTLILELLPPMKIEEIQTSSFLLEKIINKIGQVLYEKIIFAFKKVTVDKQNFKETTTKFQDIFGFHNDEDSKHLKNNIDFLEMGNINNIKINEAKKFYEPVLFYEFLMKKKPSDFYIKGFLELSRIGFSNLSINIILEYSFRINGKIVYNHFLKIANDLYSKKLFDMNSVYKEIQKASNQQQNKTIYNKKQNNFSTSDNKKTNYNVYEKIGEL